MENQVFFFGRILKQEKGKKKGFKPKSTQKSSFLWFLLVLVVDVENVFQFWSGGIEDILNNPRYQ